jgi:anti-sigma factor RsiW
MNCADCQQSIHRYLNDDLEDERLAAIEAHLADCPACRCEVENWQQCLAALEQTFPEQTVPARLWQKIPIEVVRPDTGEAGD